MEVRVFSYLHLPMREARGKEERMLERLRRKALRLKGGREERMDEERDCS